MMDKRLPLQGPGLLRRRAATMQDVALAAGVSKMTVSYAFSGKRPISPETQRIVFQAAEELNFSLNAHAQRLSDGGGQRDICLYSVNMSLGVDMLKFNCIRQKLQARGYHVSFHCDTSSINETQADFQHPTLALLRRQRPAVIICETTELQPQALRELRTFQDEGGVVISCDSSMSLDCDQVVFDHEDSLYMATRHLLEMGHRKIGLHILGPAREIEPQFVINNTKGFERALAEIRAQTPTEWRTRGLNYENHEEGGAETAKLWLSRPRETWPTAICLVNDTAAAAFIATMLRAGVRVPHDLSVIGTDDLPVALYNTVPLTTVTHPVAEMADHIVKLVAGRLEERLTGPAQKVVVRGNLVARESAAAPNTSI